MRRLSRRLQNPEPVLYSSVSVPRSRKNGLRPIAIFFRGLAFLPASEEAWIFFRDAHAARRPFSAARGLSGFTVCAGNPPVFPEWSGFPFFLSVRGHTEEKRKSINPSDNRRLIGDCVFCAAFPGTRAGSCARRLSYGIRQLAVILDKTDIFFRFVPDALINN